MLDKSNNSYELPQSSWCTLECIAYAVALLHTPDGEIPVGEIFSNLQGRLEERFYTTITTSGPIQLFNRHGLFNTQLLDLKILGVYDTLDWLIGRYELQYNINRHTNLESTFNLLSRVPDIKILQFVEIIDGNGKVQKDGHTIVLHTTKGDGYPSHIDIFDPHLPELSIIPKEDLLRGEIVFGPNGERYRLTPTTIIFHNR